jgi:hypothetical protein
VAHDGGGTGSVFSTLSSLTMGRFSDGVSLIWHPRAGTHIEKAGRPLLPAACNTKWHVPERVEVIGERGAVIAVSDVSSLAERNDEDRA